MVRDGENITLLDAIMANQAEFVGWRHALHANPGLGFQETFAAGLVEKKLREFGFDAVHAGIGKTGVVGVLKGISPSNRAIGLRADMDALPITEATGLAYSSTVPGLMHACGHDGHTATLLAAAWYLARTRDFAGTVYFIFQPAEEGLGGGRAMIDDGLFERFACDRLYAWHNMPNMPFGQAFIREGCFMAGSSFFDIDIRGTGGHAALPQTAVDPTLIASTIVQNAQSIVSRNLGALEPGIVSFTDVYAGSNSYNVIPDSAAIKGCLRFFEDGVGEKLRARLRDICTHAAALHGGTAQISYKEVFVPLVNDAAAVRIATDAAAKVIGTDKVDNDAQPVTGSEDFSFMLEKVPGAYVLFGAGRGANVHNPQYDFNDNLIALAASFLCEAVAVELDPANNRQESGT